MSGDRDERKDDDHKKHSQIITIVKQGGEWLTLSGAAHPYGNQTWLVNGHIVT